jgi:hypothetical protein
MPTNGRLSWSERLDEIQRRIGEEPGTPTAAGLSVPYFDRTLDIEPALLEVSNAALRELAIEEVGNSPAVTIVTGASPITMPVTAIRLVTATIDDFPAVEVEPARYGLVNDSPSKVFSISKNGSTRSIFHNGTTASFSFLCDQALATWQSTIAILPPAYDERTIAETVEILSLADNVEF